MAHHRTPFAILQRLKMPVITKVYRTVSDCITLPKCPFLGLGCADGPAEFDGKLEIGAGDRIRTGDIDLGKVALYQLSYSRACGGKDL